MKLSKQIIPESINFLCFYFHLDEYFDKIGSETTLENDRRHATHTRVINSHQTVYGAVIISPNRMKDVKLIWEIRIVSRAALDGIAIGIDESSAQWTDADFPFEIGTNHYSLCSMRSKGKIYCEDGKLVKISHKHRYGDAESNDTISMIFDGKSKTIAFLKNAENINEQFTDIDASKQHRLAISLKGYGTSAVEITNFCVIPSVY